MCVIEIVRSDDLGIGSNPTATSAHEGGAALGGFQQAEPGLSGVSWGESLSGLHISTAPVAERGLPVSGCASGDCNEQEGGHDRRLRLGLRRGLFEGRVGGMLKGAPFT